MSERQAFLFASSSTDNSEDNLGVGVYEGAGLVGCAKAMKEVESKRTSPLMKELAAIVLAILRLP